MENRGGTNPLILSQRAFFSQRLAAMRLAQPGAAAPPDGLPRSWYTPARADRYG